MSQRMYTTEEAYTIIAMSDNESSGELSLSDSGSEYQPVEGSELESEEEPPAPKRIRRSGPRSEDLPTTSSARPQEEELSTSTGITHPAQRDRAQSYLPDALANPLWLPANSGSATIPPFTAQPGVQLNTSNFSKLDYFYLFFPNDLLQYIVDQTNLNSEQFIAANPNSSYARMFTWRRLTLEEFKIFLGLAFNMGLSKKNESHSYWSTRPIHHMPIFSAVMSRTRFDMIMRFLHFNDNSQYPPRDHPNHDKLYKLRPLINSFTKRFSEVFIPDQNICVDESLIHFTGRLHFKQYIPSKRARYGIKMNKLCDRDTGYVHTFRIYEGKDSQLQPPDCPTYIGTSGKIVWDLAYPLFNKGYHLYVDNYYSSLPLFRHLYCEQTLACGTFRKNRKGFPHNLLSKRLQKGEAAFMRNEEVLAMKWRDKKDVHMMTTIHNDNLVEFQRRRGPVVKPECVHDYNMYMGGVDLNDQMLQPYLSTRKSKFWYKKVAFYLFHMAMYNSFVCYQKSPQNQPTTYLKYYEDIVDALIYQQGPAPGSIRSDCVSRLHEQHLPYKIPPTESRRRRQKKCRVCSSNGVRRDTSYHCPDCPSQPGLCIGDCFKIYHRSIRY